MVGSIILILLAFLQGFDGAQAKIEDDRQAWFVEVPAEKLRLQTSAVLKEKVANSRVACGISNKSQLKIVGGNEAGIHEFPWQVAINSTDGNFCGGSLLNEEWVMTSASCVDGMLSFDVFLGAHDFAAEEPDRIHLIATETVIHPNWNAGTLAGNIALIRLPSPVVLNSYISPICLPNSTYPDAVGNPVIISGWGHLSDNSPSLSSVLHKAEVTVVSQTSCRDFYGNIINGGVLCSSVSEGRGICGGDIGGPLSYIESDGRFVQLGIVSLFPSWGCESRNPDVSTRVSFYVDWISNVTGIASN